MLEDSRPKTDREGHVAKARKACEATGKRESRDFGVCLIALWGGKVVVRGSLPRIGTHPSRVMG